MNGNPLSGLNNENLTSPRRPFFVRPGRLPDVKAPFVAHGGTVVEINIASIEDYSQFLDRWNAELPLPFGEARNWDAFVDSYEEMAEDWRSPLLLVVHGIREVARRDLHLALEITFYLLDSRREFRAFNFSFTAVFVEES